MSSNAIGLIETKGYVAALAAADAMAKAASGFDLIIDTVPVRHDLNK